MTSLGRLQRDFLACLLDDAAPLPAGWDARRAAGLAVYRNAYRTRLVDALADTFARTARLAGEEAFRQAAAHHLITHPPAGWTIDLAGDGFPETCARLFAKDPDVAEVAWLEWAMHRAFTATDAAAMTVVDFRAATVDLTADQWENLRLGLVPGTALRPVAHDLLKLWAALQEAQEGQEGPQVERLPVPMWLLVWREGDGPVFSIIPEAEGRALAHIRQGGTFGEVCAALLDHDETADVAAIAGAMLSGWLETGLIVKVATA